MGDCSTCVYEDEPLSVEPCIDCQRYDEGTQGTEYSHYVLRRGPSVFEPAEEVTAKNDGSSADYYVLPEGATQLQDLISFRNMNAQMGEIFRACYRYGQGHHSPRERDLKKIIFYAQAELTRLEMYGG